MAVLIIRSPNKDILAPPKETSMVTSTPAPAPKENVQDDSHDKVAKIIDIATEAVTDTAPGLWDRVTAAWKWLMGFDAKYAIILLGAGLFFCAVIIGGKKKKGS